MGWKFPWGCIVSSLYDHRHINVPTKRDREGEAASLPEHRSKRRLADLSVEVGPVANGPMDYPSLINVPPQHLGRLVSTSECYDDWMLECVSTRSEI